MMNSRLGEQSHIMRASVAMSCKKCAIASVSARLCDKPIGEVCADNRKMRIAKHSCK